MLYLFPIAKLFNIPGMFQCFIQYYTTCSLKSTANVVILKHCSVEFYRWIILWLCLYICWTIVVPFTC